MTFSVHTGWTRRHGGTRIPGALYRTAKKKVDIACRSSDVLLISLMSHCITACSHNHLVLLSLLCCLEGLSPNWFLHCSDVSLSSCEEAFYILPPRWPQLSVWYQVTCHTRTHRSESNTSGVVCTCNPAERHQIFAICNIHKNFES
jgi:hypothetical protein